MSVNNLTIDQNGLNLIEEFEGLRLQSYQDQNGIWTIGYGSTSTVVPGGVYPGMTITQEQAQEYLNLAVQNTCSFINRVVTVPLNQNQFSALCSLVYNIGEGNFQNSTLLRVLNEGSYSEAANQILVWNMVAGSVSPGLERRRHAEYNLFNAPESSV